jgi:hypothetical protein
MRWLSDDNLLQQSNKTGKKYQRLHPAGDCCNYQHALDDADEFVSFVEEDRVKLRSHDEACEKQPKAEVHAL